MTEQKRVGYEVNNIAYNNLNGCSDLWNKTDSKTKDNFVEKLEKYFKETPRNKVLEDWGKTKKYDTVGPTIKEFLQNTGENKSVEEQRNYDSLKDVYKVEEKSLSLYHYLLVNNEFNRNKLFHQLTKEELITEYKELVKKHLKLLEEL
jgi:hypothetical protein